jgi:hypothetical protein
LQVQNIHTSQSVPCSLGNGWEMTIHSSGQAKTDDLLGMIVSAGIIFAVFPVVAPLVAGWYFLENMWSYLKPG